MPIVYLSHYETLLHKNKYIGVRFLLCEKDELEILRLAWVGVDDWVYDVHAQYDNPYNWYTSIGYGLQLPNAFVWKPVVVGNIRAWDGGAESLLITFLANVPPAAPLGVSAWE